MENDFDNTKMQKIKELLYKWAAWVVERETGGFPSQSAFVSERVQSSNRSTDSFYDNAPEDILRLQVEIERLAPLFKQVLRLEYFDKRATRIKAAVLGIPRQVFSQRIGWIHQQLSYALFGD